jgi:adenylate cyclase
MPAPRVSFKVTILTLFIVLTVGLSAVVLSVNYQRNSEATLLAAERLLEEEGERLVATTEQLIEPLFTVTNSAVLLPGLDATAGPAGEHALAPVMFSVLTRYPQMTSVYIGNGRGDFYRIAALNAVRSNARSWLQAPSHAVFALQTIASEGGRRIERWRFLDGERREVGTSVDPDESFDPRKRPWYIAAQNSKAAIVTDYYMFASVPQIGLTVARSAGDAKATVFGADLTLTSVSRALAKARASQLADARHAEIAVFNSDGRLLAHSDHVAYERLLNTSDTPRIPRVAEVGGGIMASILARGPHGAPATFHVATTDGAEWLAHVTKLTPAFGERSYVALAVPVDDVLGPLARSARETLLISLGVVLAFLPFVYLAAGAVSAPLRRLTGEVAALQNFDATSMPPVRSSIAEVHELGAALAAAKAMLAAFGKYVPKNLVQQLVGSGEVPQLGGERRSLTVFFSDVRDFTRISEEVRPERLMEFTSEYLEGLVTVILEHHGTVDKFVGDMVMALFGAPLDDAAHAEHAVEAALDMVDALHELNARWQAQGREPLDIGIGINTGPMIAGNIGSEAIMSYTVIGDAVNLGSRLESLNKQYGTRIIISQTTRAALDGRYLIRPLGEVVVKGKSEPVAIFELTGRSTTAAARVEAGT